MLERVGNVAVVVKVKRVNVAREILLLLFNLSSCKAMKQEPFAQYW